MKRVIYILAAITVVLLSLFLRFETVPGGISLSEYQLLLTKARISNDADAALQIADYYRFQMNDSVAGYRWLEIAAERGSETAKHNLELSKKNKQRSPE